MYLACTLGNTNMINVGFVEPYCACKTGEDYNEAFLGIQELVCILSLKKINESWYYLFGLYISVKCRIINSSHFLQMLIVLNAIEPHWKCTMDSYITILHEFLRLVVLFKNVLLRNVLACWNYTGYTGLLYMQLSIIDSFLILCFRDVMQNYRRLHRSPYSQLGAWV